MNQNLSLTLPHEPPTEAVTAVIDTRERRPLDLAPLPSVRNTLTTGDYSVRGLEELVAIERKSLPDLVACCGGERRRFEREVQRLLAYPVRCLVVEASWPQLEQARWRFQVSSTTVIGSILAWQAAGLPVLLAGDRERAGRCVSRLLYIAARRRWREARALVMRAADQPASAAGERASAAGEANGAAGAARANGSSR